MFTCMQIKGSKKIWRVRERERLGNVSHCALLCRKRTSPRSSQNSFRRGYARVATIISREWEKICFARIFYRLINCNAYLALFLRVKRSFRFKKNSRMKSIKCQCRLKLRLAYCSCGFFRSQVNWRCLCEFVSLHDASNETKFRQRSVCALLNVTTSVLGVLRGFVQHLGTFEKRFES